MKNKVRVIIIAANRLTTSAKVCVLKVLELNPLGMKTYDNVSFPIVDGMLVHEPTDANAHTHQSSHDNGIA